MRITRWTRPIVAAMLIMAAGTVTAKRPALAALSGVSSGQWQFHEVGTREAPRSMCVSDVRMLLQYQHPSAQCARFVLDDESREATVHYTCPGAGHGRTTLKVESSSLIRLQTQGIAGGAPFDVDLEGRRVGRCA